MSILHYIQNEAPTNSKLPLIVLHGLFGSSFNFTSILPLIKTKVLAFDLRNHGHSFHDSTMNYASMAKDMLNSLNKLGIKRCNLLGHSMGGKVAMTIALKRPELIDKLIIEDIAPVSYPLHESSLRVILDRLLEIDLVNLSDKKEALEVLSSELDLTVAQFLLTNLKRKEDGNFYWQFNLPVLSQNLSGLIDWKDPSKNFTYKGSAFWIAGKKSDYITPDIYNSLLKSFPNSQYSSFNSGHWVHFEQKMEFVQLVNDIILD